VKVVHAFAVGFLEEGAKPPPEGLARVRYNPFEAAHFMLAKTGEPIHAAPWAFFTPEGHVFVFSGADAPC
jgi:hypothetical protein